jgi:hypothetical protein
MSMAIESNLDLQLLEVINDVSDPFSDDDSSFENLQPVSKYITEDQMNSFFNLSDTSGLNFLHINCRSLKKNFGPVN